MARLRSGCPGGTRRATRSAEDDAMSGRSVVLARLAGAWCLAALAACEAAPAAEAPVGAVSPLESPAGPGSAEPNLAVGPDGRVYLSWLEPAADSAHELRFAILDGE